MSKVFRAVGVVAGVVSTIAMFVPGLQPVAIFGKAVSVAALAGAVAAVAGFAAQMTAKPPGAKGQVNARVIGANNPQPYLIGRSYSGGVQVHDVGYGGSIDKVKNPYRFIAAVYSCCGPVEELEAVQLDYKTASFSGYNALGYYADFLWREGQLGNRPEADALTPHQAGAPDWGADYKLSGFAAIGWSLRWSKKGKRFAGGQLPIMGAIWKGVSVYDPRLDGTFPGGAGSHRIDNENTWEYSDNPALHALAYAYGRYVNGLKVFGVDLGESSIDVANIVAWANVCEANGWTLGGTIWEPGDKWNNLKLIAQAGGAQPVLAGGMLQFDYQVARISLATVTRDDLAGGELSGSIGRGWKDRHNTIIPKYRSENHEWNYVQSAAVTDAAFVTADGEEKEDELQYDLVTDMDQAAELATYELYNRREAGPFSITGKPHMRLYRPGDCLTLSSELGLWPTSLKCVIKHRTIDPMTGTVQLELEAETDAKHTAAIGATGTEPDVIVRPDPDDIDDTTGSNDVPDAYETVMIGASYMSGATITATDAGASASVTIGAHDRVYADSTVAVNAATVTGLAFATTYYLYYDDADRAGGTVTLLATTTRDTALPSETNPDRHFSGTVTTPADGAADTTGYPATGIGAGDVPDGISAWELAGGWTGLIA